MDHQDQTVKLIGQGQIKENSDRFKKVEQRSKRGVKKKIWKTILVFSIFPSLSGNAQEFDFKWPVFKERMSEAFGRIKNRAQSAFEGVVQNFPKDQVLSVLKQGEDGLKKVGGFLEDHSESIRNYVFCLVGLKLFAVLTEVSGTLKHCPELLDQSQEALTQFRHSWLGWLFGQRVSQ